MKISRKIGIVISLQMGFLLGAVFTAISMIRNGAVIPVGIVMSALISLVISGIWGGIISMKDLTDNFARKFRINPITEKVKYNLLQALIGDVCFTPLLCTFFIIKNVGVQNPMFVQIWLSTLLMDFLICFPLNLIFCPIFKNVAFKVFKISAAPNEENNNQDA